MSTEVLWALAQGEDIPIPSAMFPYYVDVSQPSFASFPAIK